MPDYWNKWQKSIEIAMQTEVINKEYLVDMMRKLKFKDPIIFEKSVHAFILLSELLKYYPDLIFKGGTAILFYKFPPLRFSIDIDVILEYEEKENLSKRLGELVQNSQFFENSEPDIREGEIPKEHYKFYYHSLFTDKEEYVLLDVIFCANPYYRVLQKSLADLPLPSVDQILKVKIPTPEGLLADGAAGRVLRILRIKIEDGTQKKVAYIKNKIEEDYNPKINEIELLLQAEQSKLEEINKKIQDLLSDKKGLIARIKYLKKKDTTMKKEKVKRVNEELKAISKEKDTKMKVITNQIKVLEKELKEIKPE